LRAGLTACAGVGGVGARCVLVVGGGPLCVAAGLCRVGWAAVCRCDDHPRIGTPSLFRPLILIDLTPSSSMCSATDVQPKHTTKNKP